MGCASTNNAALREDPLSSENLLARVSEIQTPLQASKMQSNALYLQQSADEALITEQSQCARRFFVNACLDNARQARNDAWDAAQIDLSAARLYERQQQAQAQKNELLSKLKTYHQKETSQAPERARKLAAYNARQKTHADTLAQIQKKRLADKAVREQNVEDFNTKVKRIEAIKQKRINDAKKLMTAP